MDTITTNQIKSPKKIQKLDKKSKTSHATIKNRRPTSISTVKIHFLLSIHLKAEPGGALSVEIKLDIKPFTNPF